MLWKMKRVQVREQNISISREPNRQMKHRGIVVGLVTFTHGSSVYTCIFLLGLLVLSDTGVLILIAPLQYINLHFLNIRSKRSPTPNPYTTLGKSVLK